MDIQGNQNIASNSKYFSELYGKLLALLGYCGDYLNGQKHRIRPAIKRKMRKVGELKSFWQYLMDYLSGNKYGYEN